MTHQSIARRELFLQGYTTGAVKFLFKNWMIRRRIRALAGYETSVLDDIGVTREEVIWASRLPLSVNSAIALQDRSWRRRNNRFDL